MTNPRLYRLMQRCILAAVRKTKERPSTRFEQGFFDLREKLKAEKEDLEVKLGNQLQTEMLGDLKVKGYAVISGELKLGKYRGSRFVTSFKLAVKVRDGKDANQLLAYLVKTYSPKWQAKGIENGIANYNIR